MKYYVRRKTCKLKTNYIYHKMYTCFFLNSRPRKIEQIIPRGSRVLSIFTKRARPAKLMMVKPRHHFAYQWMDNFKTHKYTKFEPNITGVSRVMSIFTKRARSAKMMLGEASSSLCIPVAGQC